MRIRVKILEDTSQTDGGRVDSVPVHFGAQSRPSGLPILDSLPAPPLLFESCEEPDCDPWTLIVETDVTGEVVVFYRTSGVPGADTLHIRPVYIDVSQGPEESDSRMGSMS